LFEAIYQHGYIEDSKPYLIEALKFKLKRDTFNETLLAFKMQLKSDRTTVGMHVLFEEAIRQWPTNRITFENRLTSIIRLAGTLDSPFDIFGELIVAMVVEGYSAEAKVLFQKLSIPGIHFCRPLSRLTRDVKNLPAVEIFSHLIDVCIVAEKKKKKQQKCTHSHSRIGLQCENCIFTSKLEHAKTVVLATET